VLQARILMCTHLQWCDSFAHFYEFNSQKFDQVMYFLFFNVKAWDADTSSKTNPPPSYGGACSPPHAAFLFDSGVRTSTQCGNRCTEAV
jgi:hypothetical protein